MTKASTRSNIAKLYKSSKHNNNKDILIPLSEQVNTVLFWHYSINPCTQRAEFWLATLEHPGDQSQSFVYVACVVWLEGKNTKENVT